MNIRAARGLLGRRDRPPAPAAEVGAPLNSGNNNKYNVS